MGLREVEDVKRNKITFERFESIYPWSMWFSWLERLSITEKGE